MDGGDTMSDKKEAEDSSLTLKPKTQTNGQIRPNGGWKGGVGLNIPKITDGQMHLETTAGRLT